MKLKPPVLNYEQAYQACKFFLLVKNHVHPALQAIPVHYSFTPKEQETVAMWFEWACSARRPDSPITWSPPCEHYAKVCAENIQHVREKRVKPFDYKAALSQSPSLWPSTLALN